MPVRNRVKQYAAEQYYHVYSRGLNQQPLFLDSLDYDFFLMLFSRYLSPEPSRSPSREPYPHFASRLELVSFCLMPNHVHMLVYVHDETALTECMRSLFGSYTIYFNKKYRRRGTLYESTYLASLIDSDTYLQHISRYIHLNPRDWRHYEYSSLRFFLGDDYTPWVNPDRILQIFDDSQAKYLSFVQDYQEQKRLLDEIKVELAHE